MKPASRRSAENNPFRVSQFESLKWQPDSGSIDQIFETWQKNKFRGQLTGNHGAGKSTLSKKLKRKAQELGFDCMYLFANAESRRADFNYWESKLNEASPETLVIYDGFGHASLLRRRKLLKKQKCLVLVHSKLKKLPLICHLAPDPQLFQKLVTQLAGDESAAVLEKAGGVDFLLKKHNANLRDCFFELYRSWQNI